MNTKMIVAGLALVAAAVSAAGRPAPAEAATKTCTWGGTAAAPTGTFENAPGLTNTPNPGVITIRVTGPLGGDCRGTMSFTGAYDPGASCAAATFSGRVKGLPGVKRFAGANAAGFLPSRLYDGAGRLVGSENANAYTQHNAVDGPFLACNSPEGLVEGNFSAVIELFG